MEGSAEARQLAPKWDLTLIAASIGISLLGAFTSTQLMCQAKTSRHFAGVLVWTALGSLTFGFCSIWSLHEVAMLAYDLDLRIGIDVGLTVLSAILAVVFTFTALGGDMLYDRYCKMKSKGKGDSKADKRRRKSGVRAEAGDTRTSSAADLEPLLSNTAPVDENDPLDRPADLERGAALSPSEQPPPQQLQRPSMAVIQDDNRRREDSTTSIGPAQPLLSQQSSHLVLAEGPMEPTMPHRDSQISGTEDSEGGERDSESYQDGTESRRSSSFGNSGSSSMGLGGIMGIKRYRGSSNIPANPFVATYRTLRAGLTVGNAIKGFIFAIAITSMHYCGISGLKVPQGYVSLNPYLVVLSFIICWVVCLVGCVLILGLESHLGQQLLFSVVAATGVAAMHFTGMRAATFYSYSQPTDDRGYPPGLATAIAAVAISTCLGANLLLAHSATMSRNKLAEIVWTRRKLWMAIAQKESAESAAAARSEFIASASHEIRTPLHHLQGYSDLLSRTELTEEGRLLLFAIQRATQTLSLITNNVLDWSRLEKDGEATCRPVSLDLRTICESIVTLLPNQDEEVDVEVLVVVSPNVPHSLFIDETYIHRILMNLLSNALKFTSSGYILLSVEVIGDNLVAAVRDTGTGIPNSFLPSLFLPFTQASVRGRARGTGLGLSIIKGVLERMHGQIDVQSQYQDDEDVGPARSGSTFTITVPVQHTEAAHQSNGYHDLPKIAIFHGGSTRALEGLKAAWDKFGYEVVMVDQYADVADFDTHYQYVWADLPSLKNQPQLLHQLVNQTGSLVLIPYDTQSSLLHELPGLRQQTPSHIVPIQKPVLLHTIKKATDIAALQPSKFNVPRAVRFDPVVTDLEQQEQGQPSEGLARQQSFAEVKSIVETALRDESDPKKDRTVLLVEDNPINCKLGKKMLQTLGYQVLVAEDGVTALEQITLHDSDIDCILMDQSMPRMDGVTATKEIRAMERNGTLLRTRPIIAVTAVVGTEAQELFKLAGAEDFLAKPLSLGRLESTLAKYLKIEDEV